MSLISFESIHTTHIDTCPPFTMVHSEKVDPRAQGVAHLSCLTH